MIRFNLVSLFAVLVSGVEDYLRDLTVLDGGPVVVAGRVRELEGNFSTRWTINRNFTQTFCAVM
jgi:hypothetical protein